MDHIRPRSRGGQAVLTNLALACPRCNGAKLDRVTAVDPVSGKTVALFNPRTQVWRDHFQWTPDDPAILEGKSPVGRATVARLQMNHPGMVAARSMLVLLNRLPGLPKLP